VMSEQNSWHSEDGFWELFEPLLFNQQRQLLAQEQVTQIEKLLQIDRSTEMRVSGILCKSKVKLT